MVKSKAHSGQTRAVRSGTRSPARTRKNSTREERRHQIIAEAIGLFAEDGLDASMGEIAARIGVSQPLIFKYFPTKKDITDGVYENMYARRWNPEWENALKDRSIPLQDRLFRFYENYSSSVHTREWIRIFFFAALRNVDITKRYVSMITEHFLKPLCAELRAHFSYPGPEVTPISEREIELVWSLHSTFVYIVVRRYIFGTPAPKTVHPLIEDIVGTFLHGAEPTLGRILLGRMT